MMRDDFTLFDSYMYTPPPAFLPAGRFPVPLFAYYMEDDRRCKKEHLVQWQAYTTEHLAFTCERTAGNHLFFYDVPARAQWMTSILHKLPAAFNSTQATEVS